VSVSQRAWVLSLTLALLRGYRAVFWKDLKDQEKQPTTFQSISFSVATPELTPHTETIGKGLRVVE
jgi:hypothetical protein